MGHPVEYEKLLINKEKICRPLDIYCEFSRKHLTKFSFLPITHQPSLVFSKMWSAIFFASNIYGLIGLTFIVQYYIARY